MSEAEHVVPPEDPGRSEAITGPTGELRSVADFRLLRQVGEGGMSTVYLSYDVPGRRAVAVKLLADHLTGKQEFVNRFYREARFSRLLQHPNIVRGHAVGYDPAANRHYLVLEFVDGPSAHTVLTRLGRLPVGIAVRIGIDIGGALQFLHAHNYVHRDVKPDNILLHPDGVAKLADLGLTKRLSDDSHLTAVSQGVGTSYYMPYEQALNATLVDGRSDIFALGATLYHLLTGQVPFAGSTHDEIMREKEGDAFLPVRRLNPDVPEALADILAKTLTRDPRARFQEAADLVAALEATGLATRIPTFVPSEVPGTPPLPNPPAENTPTRADLPALSPAPPPDPAPRTAGVPPGTPLPPDGLDRFGPPESPPPPAARLSRVVCGLLVALGTSALAARFGLIPQ